MHLTHATAVNTQQSTIASGSLKQELQEQIRVGGFTQLHATREKH